MGVVIVRSKATAGGFDPTPKKGWATFLVRKEDFKLYEVLGYVPNSRLTLRSPSGKRFNVPLEDGRMAAIIEKYDVRQVLVKKLK